MLLMHYGPVKTYVFFQRQVSRDTVRDYCHQLIQLCRLNNQRHLERFLSRCGAELIPRSYGWRSYVGHPAGDPRTIQGHFPGYRYLHLLTISITLTLN